MKATRRNKRHKRGSFTVEAAYIVPVITFIIIALLYGIMVLHDRGRTLMINSNIAEKEAVRLSYGDLGSETDEAALLEEVCKECNKKNFVCSYKNAEYSFDNVNLTLCGYISGGFKAFSEKTVNVEYFVPDYTKAVLTQRTVD